MQTRLMFGAAAVLLLLVGCSNKRDLGNLPDGGGGNSGTAGDGLRRWRTRGPGGGTAGTGAAGTGTAGTGGDGAGGVAGSGGGGDWGSGGGGDSGSSGGGGAGRGGAGGGSAGTGGTAGVPVITGYPVLTAASQPFGIVAGPDGNIWFTEYGSAKIGRITPAGTITEFPTTATGEVPGHRRRAGRQPVVHGGRREQDRAHHARRSITEFPLPTAGSFPYQITAGPDGNLWFTQYNAEPHRTHHAGRRRHRVSSSDRQQQAAGNRAGPGRQPLVHRTPEQQDRAHHAGRRRSPSSRAATRRPWGIAAGPDGNLWFTEEVGDKIGRITPVGAVTEFPVPTARFRSVGHHQRPGRGPVVHGVLQNRARHDVRHFHGVRAAQHRQPSCAHHRGARWGALVRRGIRQPHRPPRPVTVYIEGSRRYMTTPARTSICR